jgi:hypothetical protein
MRKTLVRIIRKYVINTANKRNVFFFIKNVRSEDENITRAKFHGFNDTRYFSSIANALSMSWLFRMQMYFVAFSITNTVVCEKR